jgi:Gpi18-like mannosyltransferase
VSGVTDNSSSTHDRVTASREADEPDATPFDWRHNVGVPLLIYAATRIVQLLILSWMIPSGGSSLRTHLLSWDAGWFVNVAQDGYPRGYTLDASGHVTGNGLAFFPLYPWLIRAGHAVGLSYGTSALVISWLAGAVAAVLLFALARSLVEAGRFGDVARKTARATGYALVVLFCAQPMSLVESMGYTESLFVALVAGALLMLHRRAWVATGILTVAACLTRPTGAALAVAVAVAALMRVIDRDTAMRERVTAAIVGLVSLATVPAYILWVGLRVGDLRAWFTIQTAGWGSTFDFGRSTWSFIVSSVHSSDGWVALSVVAIVLAATVALILALQGPGWLPLRVYGLIAFVLVVGQAGFYHSKPRLLVPVLLLFVPAALAAGRARPHRAALWLSAYALFGLWYGAYMVTVWQYAI